MYASAEPRRSCQLEAMQRTLRNVVLVSVSLLGALACSSDPGVSASGDGAVDGDVADGGPVDGGPVDGGPVDGDSEDGGSADGGLADGGLPGYLDRYELAAEFPESGIFDPVGHAFFVGSLGDGTVHRVDAATGEQGVYFEESAPGTWWTLGMAVDTTRRRLWVCAMDDKRETSSQDPPFDGYIWVFDLESGERVANHALSAAAETATCTDVALTSSGRAFVADREHANIYEVDEVEGATLFVTHEDLGSRAIGQNALVVLPDESALLTAIYLPPAIVRVDLEDRSVRTVDISGGFSDATFLAGADGMVYSDGVAYVVFASELVRVTPQLADWSAAEAREVDVPNGMTDAIVTPNGLYLVNGQAIRFALDTEPDPFALVRFVGGF